MSEPVLDLFRSCTPIFQALGDAARQDIILQLASQDTLTVNEIAEQSHLSRPAISHHLKVLRDNGLVAIEQKGTQRYYSLSLGPSVDLLKQLIGKMEEECDL
ncbi:metalloregulator ArsR/SmtB family transcription factor [Bacillus mangrovi]|uniref:Metalloregulator ArsR/SmtB family transcription factor n=1 Tax=Metabacillus mangrovi TaxID=1491830 RepID=A0A7X2V5Y0_9BACI|nr:metalloregulator ArsR/SmtB family transcription factor [Metabacillus mangrovi]MTH54659.1 metalloregulator ArsR/SmtB family transcription factor [Metabacillus mangrovi]